MHNFFEGWYFKCQSDTHTVAVIPAIHQDKNIRTCSVQLITEENAWTVAVPMEKYQKKGQHIFIDKNRFDRKGIRLFIVTPELQVKGRLRFGELTPLKYNIMGPFAVVPFMECCHSVFSMNHVVNGTLLVNGKRYVFDNAKGYWEGDRGISFPKEYLWTQCFFEEGSIMLSVAEIPLAGRNFTGIIAVVVWQGKEYRFATYLGARVIELNKGTVRIVQGDKELVVRLLEPAEKALRAPTNGAMTRTVHESIACLGYYELKKRGAEIFRFETSKASFEYEYNR